ncbi:MAG: hypothetical protein Kow00122_09180 [Thermoleophilia bacterium]
MDVTLESVPGPTGWLVRLIVGLDRRETNELFLVGDVLISWPTDGLLASGAGPMDRSSMFLSEIVSRPGGLELAYESQESARRAAKVLDYQLRTALTGA